MSSGAVIAAATLAALIAGAVLALVRPGCADGFLAWLIGGDR